MFTILWYRNTAGSSCFYIFQSWNDIISWINDQKQIPPLIPAVWMLHKIRETRQNSRCSSLFHLFKMSSYIIWSLKDLQVKSLHIPTTIKGNLFGTTELLYQLPSTSKDHSNNHNTFITFPITTCQQNLLLWNQQNDLSIFNLHGVMVCTTFPAMSKCIWSLQSDFKTLSSVKSEPHRLILRNV